MIVVFTKAFNAEKTLDRCVQSVLRQTYDEFIYYLCDNASTDDTWEVMQELANRDARIHLLRNQGDQTSPATIRWGNVAILHHLMDGVRKYDHFCTLDADDEYMPEFLGKMLDFMKENSLLVARSGTDWVDAETGAFFMRKQPSENIVLEGRDFVDRLPDYRSFVLTVWGGLYSFDVLKKCNFSLPKSNYFHDTIIAMEAFRNSGRAGVLAESLHKYYVTLDRSSYQYDSALFLRCKNFLDYAKRYMLHFGELNRPNENYLQVLFLIMLKYILPRIQYADTNTTTKLNDLLSVFTDDATQRLLHLDWRDLGIRTDKAEFLHEAHNWVESLDTQSQDAGDIWTLVSQTLTAIMVENGVDDVGLIQNVL